LARRRRQAQFRFVVEDAGQVAEKGVDTLEIHMALYINGVLTYPNHVCSRGTSEDNARDVTVPSAFLACSFCVDGKEEGRKIFEICPPDTPFRAT